MNSTRVDRHTPTEQDDVWAITLAEILEENDRLKARIASLEENAVWLSALLKVALHQLHEYHVDGVWAREHRRGVDADGFLTDEREWAA